VSTQNVVLCLLALLIDRQNFHLQQIPNNDLKLFENPSFAATNLEFW